MDQQVVAGADLAGRIASAIKTAADELGRTSPALGSAGARRGRQSPRPVAAISRQDRRRDSCRYARLCSAQAGARVRRRRGVGICGLPRSERRHDARRITRAALCRDTTIGDGAHPSSISRPEMCAGVEPEPAWAAFMPTDLRHSALSHAVGDVLQDVSDLVQKELQFARAELASNLDAVLRKVAGVHRSASSRWWRFSR